MDEQNPPPTATTASQDPGTQQQPGPHDEPSDHDAGHGPRVTRDQVLDTARLRRSRDDRYVAGVAGGLGRHLDVDPLLVRIVLAVLTLFGAAGVVVYVAVWLLVPEDGSDRAVVRLRAETLRVVLLGVVAVAAVLVLGLPWGDPVWFFWTPWPLLILIALGVWLVARRRPEASTPPPPAPPAPPHPASPGEPSASYATVPLAAPRPRRTGVVLFWPTLALVAIALGVVGLVDARQPVPLSAYAATGLAVTGLALLLGAFRGRPGGLIALGLALTLTLAGTSAADAVRAYGPYGTATVTPTSVAEIEAADGVYLPDSGDFTLDLREVDDLAALDGRSIAVQMDVGRLSVILPRDLGADVDAYLRYAGELDLDGERFAAGLGAQSATSFPVVAPGADPVVNLDLTLGVGDVEVVRDVDALTPQETP